MTAGIAVVRPSAPCSFGELCGRARPALRSAGVQRAVAFGSWARGEADGCSDLDLAVVLDTALPRPERAMALAAELDRAPPVVADVRVHAGRVCRRPGAGFGVFDALAREGVDVYPGGPP